MNKAKTFLSIFLLPLTMSNINPVLAEAIYQDSRIPTETRAISNNSDEFLIAGFGDFIRDVKKVVEDGTGAVRTVKDTVNYIEDRERLQKAREAATERQLQEAERRRQYWESLSPEEQQAYIKKQQELDQKQAEVAASVFLLLLSGGDSGGESASGSTCGRDVDKTTCNMLKNDHYLRQQQRQQEENNQRMNYQQFR